MIYVQYYRELSSILIGRSRGELWGRLIEPVANCSCGRVRGPNPAANRPVPVYKFGLYISYFTLTLYPFRGLDLSRSPIWNDNIFLWISFHSIIHFTLNFYSHIKRILRITWFQEEYDHVWIFSAPVPRVITINERFATNLK